VQPSEADGDASAEPPTSTIILLDGVAQNISNLGLETAAMLHRPPLEAGFDIALQITNDELGHETSNKMISRYHRIGVTVKTTKRPSQRPRHTLVRLRIR
jgi:hypothetical protein